MNCQYCGKPLPAPAPGGHRIRAYCNQACKQAHYRKQHATKSQAQPSTELQEALARIEELETQVMRLRNQLDVESRYLEDRKAWTFKAWLKKQPSTPFRARFLADEIIPPRASRSMYQAQMRRLGYTSDDLDEFADLWKLMLMKS